MSKCRMWTKKPLAGQRIFVQTSFSDTTLNLERKNVTPQNHSLFRSTSCFGVTKILLQFDFKDHENVSTDLKNITGRIPEATRSVKTLQKTVIAAQVITICIKPVTHYPSGTDLKIGEI